MKQIVIVAALFVAVLALALWALGVFETAPTLPPETPPEAAHTPTAPVLLPLPNPEPKTEPPPDIPEIPAPVRVLVLAQAPRVPFIMWFSQVWEMTRGVTYQVWSATVPEGVPPNRPHSPTLEELTAPPKTADLADVQVLVVDDFDPKAMPDEFWQSVAERVKKDRLGLMIHPGNLYGQALAEHPALKSILPVAAVKPFKPATPGAEDIPGVFQDERPFAPTAQGLQNPASRISSFVKWSKFKWDDLATGTTKWGTKFVYPVETPAPRATVLLNVNGPRGEKYPALILSNPSEGRVVWVGFYDLGQAAYRDTGSHSWDAMRSLLLNWILWLSTPP